MAKTTTKTETKSTKKKVAVKAKRPPKKVVVAKKKTVKRRKNLDHRDADHPIEVTKHFRSGPPGYLTPWQRAHHAGQADLFAHGIKPAKLRQRNPDLEQQAIEDRKEFAGHYDGPKNVYTPAGTPQGISRLGQLAELHLVGGVKLYFLHDKAEYILAQDTSHKLHIASTEPGAMVDNEPGDYGEIKKVEYLERKTHLADGNELIQWVHKMGEITGKRPSLRVDKNRQLRIVGGDYSINWRGIIN